MKIDRRYATEHLDYLELVSDVIYSIISKLDNDTYVNKYYEMLQNNGLFLYIVKAINTNAKFKRAPFLQKKLKQKNRISYIDNVCLNENDKAYTDQEEEVLDEVISCLTPENAKQLFGKQWKYYSTIFHEYYFNTKTTYQSLSEKYRIPKSSISRDLVQAKNIIIIHLENEKLI